MAYFGIRAVESRPAPKDDGEKRTELKKDGESPQAKERREESRNQKQKRVEEEAKDRKQTDQKLTELEKKLAADVDKNEKPEVIRDRWLRGIEQTLKLTKGSLKLGEPDVKIRRPVEQHGIYLNGKIIGNIAAGFEKGRVVRDEFKYDYDKSPDPDFREKGFRLQVIEVFEQAQGNEEK